MMLNWANRLFVSLLLLNLLCMFGYVFVVNAIRVTF